MDNHKTKGPAGLQVLIVDDSGFSRNMMTKALLELGFESSQIRQASSGDEALVTMESKRFDLFFLDIVMSGIDGIAVLKEVKKQQPAAKVIMCSGSSSPDLIKDLIAMGIDGFVVKPFKVEDFVRAVCSNISLTSDLSQGAECLQVKCHRCDRKMIEVNSINTVSFYCPSNCMQIGPVVYALLSQQQLDEDYARAKGQQLLEDSVV